MNWIGEISLMKDLTATMDITLLEEEAAEAEAAAAAAAAAEAGDSEFPGTDEAIKESMKTAGAERDDHPKATTVEEEVEMEGKGHAKEAEMEGRGHGKGEPITSSATASASASTANLSGGKAQASPSVSGRNTPNRFAVPIRPALMEAPSDGTQTPDSSVQADDKDGRKKDKKSKLSLTKEQREQLAALEKERARVRQERVDTLAQKLLDRVSLWTETDRGADVTRAFQEKIRLEVEELKMESFGIDILHAIGQTYVSKATVLLRSQKLFGMGGFFSRMRDKGTLVKDTWNTISSAIEAQQTMEEMARMEERGGEEWTDEKKTEYERRVTGKILTAAWRGSKFEIQSVLRDVCDAVLADKKVSLSKRLERAEALVLIGDICNRVSLLALFSFLFSFFFFPPPFHPLTLQAFRTAEEEGDYMAFEQLVAEAAMKKDKESKKKGKDKSAPATGSGSDEGASKKASKTTA